MAKRRAAIKRGFMDVYEKTYDPAVEGFGSQREWQQAFRATMGLDEARGVLGALTPEQILDVPVGAVWSVIKSAFRKMSMECHPDRCAIHGLAKAEAEKLFRMVSAAYVVLEAKHGQRR